MRRVCVELEDDFYEQVKAVLPWGTKGAAIRRFLEIVVDKVEKEDSHAFLGALLRGDLTLAIRGSNANG